MIGDFAYFCGIRSGSLAYVQTIGGTMRGFQESELFDKSDPAEYEANLFSAELIIPDEELLDLINDRDKSFFSIAKELYVPAELLDFKFRILKSKGLRIESPYIARADFLKNDFPGCFE